MAGMAGKGPTTRRLTATNQINQEITNHLRESQYEKVNRLVVIKTSMTHFGTVITPPTSHTGGNSQGHTQLIS